MVVHPYTEFEKSDIWISIEDAIDELIMNKDIELTTSKEYVVGYLCKKVSEAAKLP